MRKKIKYFGLILALMSVSILVSGCSSRNTTEEEAKVFTIWAFDDEDVWKPIIRDIKKELGDYEIKYIKKELNSTYENDALNSILSGEGPDVWAIPNDWVYRHKNKLEPMPETMTAEINLDTQFVPIVKENVYFDDKIYALTPTVDTLSVYFNNKVFEKAYEEFQYSHDKISDRDAVSKAGELLDYVPTTWSDFIETSKLITLKNGDTITRSGAALGTANNISNAVDILYAMMLQNGTKMTSDDLQTANFNLPQETITNANDNPAKRALEFYSSFSDPNSSNYSWNQSMGSDIEAFARGDVAMIFGFQSLGNYFAQMYPNLTYKKAALPQINSIGENITDYGKFTAFVVPAASNKKEGAWMIINYLAGEYANQYASTVNINSSLAKANFLPSLEDRGETSIPEKYQTEMAKNWNKGRYPNEIDSIFKNTVIGNVANKNQSSQEALDTGADKITEILRKNGW